MNKYQASEQAYKNGYAFGKKVKQEKYAAQFIKGFSRAIKPINCENCTYYDEDSDEQPCCNCIDFINFENVGGENNAD